MEKSDAPSDLSPPPGASSSRPAENDNIYGADFWFCYAANTMLMIAVSLLFRYADFVENVGGNEMDLGLIVGVGTVGGIAMRVVHGVGIDFLGPRRVWLASLVLLIVSLLAHRYIITAEGPAVYLARILMTTGLAGAFGASITYVSLRVPEQRTAEMVGMLGSSGFVGIALGPTLGDLLFSLGADRAVQVDRMFLAAAAMVAVSLCCAVVATRREVRRKFRRPPPFWAVLKRYNPGVLLLVAAAMGFGIGMPHTFLKAYAGELQFEQIKVYFLVYAAVAFFVRVQTRRLTERVGARPVILMGLAALSSSMLLYLVVAAPWMLAIPAVVAGIAHAFLFPAVVGSGSIAFPYRYRGLATTLVLAVFDLGNLIGQPLIGGILHFSRVAGAPAYPTMFVTVAVLIASMTAIYAWFSVSNEPPQQSNQRRGRRPRVAQRGAPNGQANGRGAAEPAQATLSDR